MIIIIKTVSITQNQRQCNALKQIDTEPRPPPMGQEAPADVSRAVAAWGRAAHAVRLSRFPDELRAVHVAVLLPLRRQGTARRAAVGGIFPRHVTLSITAGHRTPERGHKRAETSTAS